MNENILCGPPITEKCSKISLGEQLFTTFKKKRDSNKFALKNVGTENGITFKEFFETSVKLATWMRDYGLTDSDVIMVCSENCYEYFIPIAAAFFNGLPVTTVNHTYTISEFQHYLKILKPAVIFCSKATFLIFFRIYRVKQPIYARKVIMLDHLDVVTNSVMSISNFKPKKVDVNETALIIFSSGTTGFSKAVQLTHANINIRLAWEIDLRINVYNDLIQFLVIPFYHGLGFIVTLVNLMRPVLATTLFLNKFEPHLFLKTIETYKLREMVLVPPILFFLAKTPLVNKYDISSVQSICSGAAPLKVEIENKLRERMPSLTFIKQTYGSTETMGVSIFYDNSLHKPGSSGQITPGTTIKICDLTTNESLPPNKPGEICVKSPMIMKGYYNNYEATKSMYDEEGWFRTGDIGYYDEDEHLYIVGRIKELIKYKGFQVAPAELEATLIQHPEIDDAGVIGVPDEDCGELPCAFIVRRSKSLTDEEVQIYLRDKHADFKQLRGGIFFIDSIPRNLSGKILRNKLEHMISAVKSKL